jgi:hypothetical protein
MEFKNELGKTLVNTMSFTDAERAGFLKGWKDAGGYMGDADSPAPLCAPWYHDDAWIEIANEAQTPQQMGAGCWGQSRNL